MLDVKETDRKQRELVGQLTLNLHSAQIYCGARRSSATRHVACRAAVSYAIGGNSGNASSGRVAVARYAIRKKRTLANEELLLIDAVEAIGEQC